MSYNNLQSDYSGAFHDFWWTTWNNVGNALQGMYHYLGAVIAAFVILVIGLVIAAVVRYVIVWFLEWLQLGRMAKQLNLDRFVNVKYNWTPLVGDMAWWFIVVTFFLAAMASLGLGSYFIVDRYLAYVPTAFLGASVVFVGFIFASLISRVSMAVADWLNIHSAAAVGGAVRAAIYVVTALFALDVFGVPAYLVQYVIFGVIAGGALAFGLALGLGGRDAAAGLLKRWSSLWPSR